MRLKSLELFQDFRGLPKEGFRIDFDQSISENNINPKCFVGLNGSGKSNVLETIAEIFYYLETYHLYTEDKPEDFKTDFGFKIEYYLPYEIYSLGLERWPELYNEIDHTNVPELLFRVVKRPEEYPVGVAVLEKNVTINNEHFFKTHYFLPRKVIGYSSGMNELISNPFIKIDMEYFDGFKKKSGDKSKDATLETNRLFFMDYNSNQYMTLSNYLFDRESVAELMGVNTEEAELEYSGKNLFTCNEKIKIKDLNSFTIKIQRKKNVKIPIQLEADINRFKKCCTCYDSDEEFVVDENGGFVTDEDERIVTDGSWNYYEFFFSVNESTKFAFQVNFKTSLELFKTFYFFNLLNLNLTSDELQKKIRKAEKGVNISALLPKHEEGELVFTIKDLCFDKKGCDKPIYYKQLSDGEHQLLHILGAINILDEPGTLFLLDEPETHFNPNWRSNFISIISEASKNRSNQDLILTTHSPFIVSDCQPENVFKFYRNSKNKVCFEKPNFNTFGSSVSIISEKLFDQDDTISDLSKKLIDKIMSMPTSTMEEIQAAKEASRQLGESVEKVLLFRELILKEEKLKDA